MSILVMDTLFGGAGDESKPDYSVCIGLNADKQESFPPC